MGELDDVLAGLDGFECDEGNAATNWLRHQVRQGEAEQATAKPARVPHVKPSTETMAEKGGSRTLRGPYGPQTGFEDQRHHRAPSFSNLGSWGP